jgi:Peptidase family S41/N-terminal domain of Peptidase_S41 in eukaryotic IRBP
VDGSGVCSVPSGTKACATMAVGQLRRKNCTHRICACICQREIALSRFTSLLLIALVPCCPSAAQVTSLDRGEKDAVVQKIGDMLTVNYVFPERAAMAKAKITNALVAGDYDEIEDPSIFAQRLTADLQSVTHDRHMRVFTSDGQRPPPDRPPPPPSYAGFARVDLLKDNIGYIKLLGFPPPGPFDLVAAQALADLAGTDALIIDMRDNRGGSPDSVAYLCSFFFDPKTPVHLNDLIYRKPGTVEFTTKEFWTKAVNTSYLNKPVYLLISKRTFSGGEEFVNDLKAQKRAKVFGETTGGGANPGNVLPIGTSFSIFIPSGRAENPVTRTSWEGSGVTPDVAVQEKQALQAAVADVVGGRYHAAVAAVKRSLAAENDDDSLVESHLLKFRTTPLPGGAEAVRRTLGELAHGTPNYDRMSPDLAEATRAQLPSLQPSIQSLGAVSTVTFNRVGSDGLDVYDVRLAKGALQCGIFVAPDGRIVSAWMHVETDTTLVTP